MMTAAGLIIFEQRVGL